MIFKISPKLSKARDLPQTYRQTLQLSTDATESLVNNSTDQDAWIADEVGAVTEVSQVRLHHSFHFVVP